LAVAAADELRSIRPPASRRLRRGGLAAGQVGLHRTALVYGLVVAALG